MRPRVAAFIVSGAWKGSTAATIRRLPAYQLCCRDRLPFDERLDLFLKMTSFKGGTAAGRDFISGGLPSHAWCRGRSRCRHNQGERFVKCKQAQMLAVAAK